MKKLLSILFSLWLFNLSATHNRAGEITYRWLNGLTYEVTITTYTRSCDLCADRCELEINWGDGNTEILPRNNGNSNRCPNARDGVIIDPANQIRKNTYVGTHTYPAPGSYLIYMEDRNRNSGINNILNSDQVPFYIASELFISPSLGGNSSPILTNAPVERGCINRRFEHNPGAFDPDGDSLAYRLAFSRAENGDPIQTIYDPQYVNDSVRIDPNNGTLYWDLPRAVGQFNFALEVVEYRKNAQGRYVRIGYVTRDIQVDIEDCGNNPPEVQPTGPFCVEAGTRLSFPVRADDVDNDVVELSAFGGPFEVSNSAIFNQVTGRPILTGTFVWDTQCSNRRKQPYQVTFRAEDSPPDPFDISLIDFETVEIKVVAPAPRNPSAAPEGRAMRLTWGRSPCNDAEGYLLYRRESAYGFVPGPCELGVPAYTGYEFLDTVLGLNTQTYLDTNNLETGKQYCYMVVAYFADEDQSYASDEFCAALPLDLPLITHADVQETSPNIGAIRVAWIAPPEFDSVLFPPPYRYDLLGREAVIGSRFNLLSSINGLNDTAFLHQGINTEDAAYRYKVELFSGPNGDLVGPSSEASSLYLRARGVDRGVQLNFEPETPWSNERYIIYREDAGGNLDSIGESFQPSYRDTGLVNGESYCYLVESYGRYTASDSLPAPLINKSQLVCAVARDTIAPCAPQFSLVNVCPDTIYFSWRLNQNPECDSDISRINIYFRTGTEGYSDQPLLSIPARGDSTIKFVSDASIFGCYVITAVDDANLDPGGAANESAFSEEVCIESCFTIGFPNVFTPNGDLINDQFLPTEIDQVMSLEIQIFNRWGLKVYEAGSVEEFLSEGWRGQDQSTGRDATDGVYYYICRYRAESLGPATEQVATGFVHLFR